MQLFPAKRSARNWYFNLLSLIIAFLLGIVDA